MAMKGHSAFPELPDWNFNIRLFSAIPRTLIGWVGFRGFLFSCRDAVGIFYSPHRQSRVHAGIMSFVDFSERFLLQSVRKVNDTNNIINDFLPLLCCTLLRVALWVSNFVEIFCRHNGGTNASKNETSQIRTAHSQNFGNRISAIDSFKEQKQYLLFLHPPSKTITGVCIGRNQCVRLWFFWWGGWT